jgi:5-methylcytosine-specific restriction endonuclease McrA
MSRSRAACGIRFRHLKKKPVTKTKKLCSAASKRERALMQLGFVDYRAYLRSPLWKAIRDHVIEIEPRCELCGDKSQCVHHIDYSKLCLIGKKLWKLVSLCNQCHRDIEFLEDGTKRNFEAASKRTRKLLIKNNAWEKHKK